LAEALSNLGASLVLPGAVGGAAGLPSPPGRGGAGGLPGDAQPGKPLPQALWARP